MLEKAAAPYFVTLRSWIHYGEIVDPYDEFMIQERKGVSKEQLREDFNDVYWEQRYTLRRDTIPAFLLPFAEKILLAGKYLNVVRECGIAVPDLDERFVRKNTGPGDLSIAFGDAARIADGGR